jgi:hypothetical protein
MVLNYVHKGVFKNIISANLGTPMLQQQASGSHGQVNEVSQQQQQQSTSSDHGGYYTNEHKQTKIDMVVPKIMASLWDKVTKEKEKQEKEARKHALHARWSAEDLLRSAPDLDRPFTLDDDMSTYSSPSPPPSPCFSLDSSTSPTSPPPIFTFPAPVKPLSNPHLQFSIPVTFPDGSVVGAAYIEFLEDIPGQANGPRQMETGKLYIDTTPGAVYTSDFVYKSAYDLYANRMAIQFCRNGTFLF